MFDVITFGSATQDIILKPKHLTSLKYEKSFNEKEVCFPFGSKIEVEDMIFSSGGGGTNTAATFALQGFKTAFCGMVGSDVSGQEIINELKKLKINTSLVQKTDQKRTNHSVVILNGGLDRTIMAYRGAAELMADVPFKKLKTHWLYLAPLSGLFCQGFNRTIDAGSEFAATMFSDIVQFAVNNNIKIAVNPGMAQLSLPSFTEIAKKIDVLIMNQEEASFLTKVPVDQEKEIFKKLDDICAGITVMTKGGNGVTVSDGPAKLGSNPAQRGGKIMYSAVPSETRKIVDTTGAGDAFGSGFISGLMLSEAKSRPQEGRSSNIEAAIQLGMANSVACLTEFGAKHGLLERGQEFEKVEVKKENIINS